MGASSVTHVLLDRDGVLNVERAGIAVTEAAHWLWIDGSRAALAKLLAAGRRVAIATNQSIVGHGLVTPAEVDALHHQVLAEVAALDFVLYCPHARDSACSCRKPAPGLLEEACARWGVAPAEVLFIGDALTDLEASRAASTRFALVRTGKGAATEARITASERACLWGGRSFADLAEVVADLLAPDEADEADEARGRTMTGLP